MTVERRGGRPVDVNVDRLSAGISDEHIEILRGELTRILYDATRTDVEYLFGDSIATLHDDGSGVDVTFEHAAPRRFDLVIGADGLHSTVRRLVFGPEEGLRRPLGGYLAVYSLPDLFDLGNRMLVHIDVNRIVTTYGVHQTGQARAFLFPQAGGVAVRPSHQAAAADRRGRVPRLRLAGSAVARASGVGRRLLLRRDQPDRPGQLRAAGSRSSGTRDSVPDRQSAVGRAWQRSRRTYWRANSPARDDLPAGLRAYEQKISRYVELSRAAAVKTMRSVIPRQPNRR